MNNTGFINILINAFSGKKNHTSPRIFVMRKFHEDGCKFEVSSDMESFRIEDYGDEEEFTGIILDEVKPGDVFLDIGACVGLVSVHAAKKGARVFSFEPDTYYRSRLINNLMLNRLDTVKIIDWAVSDNEGEVVLFTDGEDGNSPSLKNVGDRGSINVKTDSIDNAVRRGEIPVPDVIKLDIEGAEMWALRGMQKVLVSAKCPRAIFIEVHPDYLKYFGSSTVEVEDYLLKCGYTLDYKIERSNQLHCIFRK